MNGQGLLSMTRQTVPAVAVLALTLGMAGYAEALPSSGSNCALCHKAVPPRPWIHSAMGCSSCHVPHHAVRESDDPTAYDVPLWSPVFTADVTVFTLYASATFDGAGTISQPDGPSKLCLGCHDGTYAGIGGHVLGEGYVGHLGTGLDNDHPVSFKYDAALIAADSELEDPLTASSGIMNGSPSTIKHDLLDKYDKVQCSSCHDVHSSALGIGLLRWNINSPYDPVNPGVGEQGMCRVCHKK